jgi:hypothetical protein
LTLATGLSATVDVAHEAGVRRIGPRTDGADLRVALGVPLRLLLLAGRGGGGLAAGRAAALSGCTDLVLALRADARTSFVERATAIRDARADAVLVVADGADADGVLDLVEALRFACGGQEPPPAVLLAGDDRARARVSTGLGAMTFEAMPDTTTAQGREAIVARLRAMRRGTTDVVLRDEAIEAASRALAGATGRSTLVVDVNGSTTSLAYAGATGPVWAMHVRHGIGANADRIVTRTGLDRVRRWLPRAIDSPALLERVFNRARWPDAVAPSALTLVIEMSLAREAIAHAMAEAERAEIPAATLRAAQNIVCTGDLARFPRASQAVLVAVDAIGPEGTQLIAREHPDALVAAGALASRSPADVIAAIEPLALVATMWPRRAATVRVTDASGLIEERVARGAFFLTPTAGNVALQLGTVAAPATADALALGVVVDARGRPLELPPRDAERIPTLARWHGALDALPFEAGE